MDMDGLTIDQFRTLIVVVDHGGFSPAARAMNRSQSAVTYSIQKLEDQIGLKLFDRSGYRPTLTEAGHALLPRARRVVDDVSAFRAQVVGMARGIEPEVTLVVDPVFPVAMLLRAMSAFRDQFPEVRTRVYAESLGGGSRLLIERICAISIGIAFTIGGSQFERVPLAGIPLTMVAAPHHPLARLDRAVTISDMRDHVQLVLTDRSALAGEGDHGVFADHTWRLGDLGTKHAMLVAGFGFGSLPAHMVAADLDAGRLVRIKLQDWDGRADGPILPMCAGWLAEAPPGPAGRWLVQRLSNTALHQDAPAGAPGLG